MTKDEAIYGTYEIVFSNETGKARFIQYTCDLKPLSEKELLIPDAVTVKPKLIREQPAPKTNIQAEALAELEANEAMM